MTPVLHRLTVALAVLAITSAPAAAQTAHPSFDVKVTGRGPALILIPGLMSSGAVWDATAERYQDRYALHVLTLAGFGGPPPVGEPFLSRVRDEVIRYVRENKLERPILVGHSLGGFLAFWIAATAPDLVGGVVAVDGVPFLPALGNPSATADGMQAQAKQLKTLYASFSREQLVGQSRVALGGMITSPAHVDRALAWVAQSDPAAVGIAVAEVMSTDLRERIASIAAPVLLIGALGAAPEAMRPALTSAYRAQMTHLPSARIIMAERARHFVLLDDPAFFFATVDEFLATSRGQAGGGR